MTSYWDTSAAINALVSPEVFARLKTGRHISRLHMLAEFNATEVLTRNTGDFAGLAKKVTWP